MEVTVDDKGVVTVKFPLSEGKISKRGRSYILFSTGGWEKVPERDGESIAINYIRKL